jgi:signal transduction histidine kinase
LTVLRVSDDAAAQEEVSARELLAEQVRLVHSTASRSAWTMTILSAFVALVLRDVGWGIAVWLAVQVSLKVAAYVELRWFFPEARIAADPEGMLRQLMLTQSPHAVGWASLMWLVAPHGAPFQMTLVMMVFGGVLSGGTTTYGALPRLHLAYLLSFSVALLMTWAFVSKSVFDDPALVLVTVLSIFFCGAIFMNTRVAGRTYHQFILLGFANARLARRLEEEVASTRQAQLEAEAANAAKSTFLAAASHDLRQPIHALGLFLALLERSKLTGPQRETLALARSALSASSEMLDTLLDFSRAEAGVIVPRVQPFRIGETLRQIEAELAMTADAKQLVYRTRDSDAVVESDPGLVRIILMNLVSNAIRYTAAGGVLVGVRRRGEDVMMEVWDTGVGIAPGDREQVFSDFIQLGNPERDRRKGLGLGLAIARRLARLVGSEITVASEVGGGSVFRFRLPRSQQALAEPLAGAAGPGVAVRRGHVLIIDDDDAIRLGLGQLLRERGHTVDAVETIAEAQASAERQAPDVMICDYRLRAGESGAEAARLLRTRLGRRVPAMLITGDTHPDRIAEAAREDMEIFYKPTQPDQLLAAVDRLMTAG